MQLDPELIEATKRALVTRLRNMGEYVPGSEIITVPGYSVGEVAKATIELAAQGYLQFYGPYGNYILLKKLGDEFRTARWQRDARGHLAIVSLDDSAANITCRGAIQSVRVASWAG